MIRRVQIASAGTLITRFRFEGRKEVHMKTTRIMAVAVLTMGSALALYIAQQAKAKAQAPGITRTDLQRHDLSVPGREVVQVRVAFEPGVVAPRHSHPGEEIVYEVEGSLEYRLEGKPPVTLKAGETIGPIRGVLPTRRFLPELKSA